jgi:nitrogen regulatory protein P-II 1
MKEIKAILQPFVVSRVIDALKEMEGVPGVTVSEVRGFGRGRAAVAPQAFYDGGIEYVKKAKLEIVVHDNIVQEVVTTIARHAHTGNPGDGKIFVSAVDEVVRIRTG